MSQILLAEINRFIVNSSNRNFETKFSNNLLNEEIYPNNV